MKRKKRSFLLSAFAIVLLANTIYFLIGHTLLNDNDSLKIKIDSLLQKTIPALNLSGSLMMSTDELRYALLDLRLQGKPSAQIRNSKEQQAVSTAITDYYPLIESTEEHQIYRRLQDNWLLYLDGLNEQVQSETDFLRSIDYLRKIDNLSYTLVQKNNDYIGEIRSHENQSHLKAAQLFSYGFIFNLIFQAIAVTLLYRLYISKNDAILSAEVDPLTGLYNRRKIARTWDKINIHNSAIVVLTDIDFFKKINDTYGHDGGDFILREVALLFQQIIGEQGVIARVGGEEFAFLFKKHTVDQAFALAEQIRNSAEQRQFDYNGTPIQLTLSFGIARATSKHDSFEKVYSAADRLLYQAKHSGRNRVCR